MSQIVSGSIPLPMASASPVADPLAAPPVSYGKNPHAAQMKMLWHLDRLAEWHQRGDTFPVLMEANLTNYCNQACSWCISSYSHVVNPAMTAEEKGREKKRITELPALTAHPERQRGLDVGVLGPFLARARQRGLRAVTWSGGGEPTTHPEFLAAVTTAADVGIEQGLMTNGLWYKPSYTPVVGQTLKWVRVSLDTLDATRYQEQKRTGGFPQVIANVRGLVKHPVKVGVNMNLANWNNDEILSLVRWCREEGVDYCQIRPVLGLPFEMTYNAAYRSQPQLDWPRLEPTLREAEALSTDAFRAVVSWDKFDDVRDVPGNFGRAYKKCLSHYFVCVLNADGDLSVCMYHLGDKAFTFGNIYENTLDEIWDGEQRRQVVDLCANRLDLSTCQVCCKGHEINKLMHLIETPDPRADVNFL